MEPLIEMGLRTVAYLDTKEQFYQQIETGALRATPRLEAAHLETLAGPFTLGILSSHPVSHIRSVVEELGWLRYFPPSHLIASEGHNRKDPKNWGHWREEFR